MHHPTDRILTTVLNELQLGDKARAEPIFSRKLTQFVQLTDCPRSYSSSDENVAQTSCVFQSPALVVDRGLAPSPNGKVGQFLVPDDLMDERLDFIDAPRLSWHIIRLALMRMAHAIDTTLPLPKEM